jgi:hypothetical protein
MTTREGFTELLIIPANSLIHDRIVFALRSKVATVVKGRCRDGEPTGFLK